MLTESGGADDPRDLLPIAWHLPPALLPRAHAAQATSRSASDAAAARGIAPSELLIVHRARGFETRRASWINRVRSYGVREQRESSGNSRPERVAPPRTVLRLPRAGDWLRNSGVVDAPRWHLGADGDVDPVAEPRWRSTARDPTRGIQMLNARSDRCDAAERPEQLFLRLFEVVEELPNHDAGVDRCRPVNANRQPERRGWVRSRWFAITARRSTPSRRGHTRRQLGGPVDDDVDDRRPSRARF
jgi:hypothetical protein